MSMSNRLLSIASLAVQFSYFVGIIIIYAYLVKLSIFSFSKYGPHPAYLVIWLIMNTEYLPNYAHGSPDLSLCVALLCYELACPAGLEPATYGLEDRCSNPTELRAE